MSLDTEDTAQESSATTFESQSPVGDELDQMISEVSEQGPVADVAAQAKPQEAQTPKYKYTARGKEIEEPLDVILKRASMGYDYAQSQEQLKAQTAEWQAQLQAAKELEARWKPFDDYAKQYPDWREHIEKSWQERQAQPANGQLTPDLVPEPVIQELTQLKAQLGELSQFAQEVKHERSIQQQKELDQALSNSVKAIQEKYSYVDFQTPDPTTGKSLELQVLEYAQANGIPSFSAAFHDFYHDKLIAQAETRAKEAVGKEIAKAKKAGFIGVSPTPTMKVSQATDLKRKSWDDLIDESLAELTGS